MARPEAPRTWEATEESLIPASWEDLLQALGLPGPLLDLGLAVPGEVAELPDLPGRHERGPDQAVLDELGDPRGVGHVGLAPGDVAKVPGVEQPALEGFFEQVVDRAPVDPGRLHPDHGDPVARQVVPQHQQPRRGRGEGRCLPAAEAALSRHPHARHHGVLVHVQAGASVDEPVHPPSFRSSPIRVVARRSL
jgi:hypothetical protein